MCHVPRVSPPTPSSRDGHRGGEPCSLPGLAPRLPDPSWAGPGREAPGGHCSAAPFFLIFFCFSGEVVLSVWGSRVDRFELQRSRRELCSPPGGWAGGGGPWDRGQSIARPGSSVVLPWTARDPGDCSRARPRIRGAGLGRAGGFWLRGSLSFAEGSEGSPVASLHFWPSTHTFQRQTLSLRAKQAAPLGPVRPAAPLAGPGLPGPVGSCLLLTYPPKASVWVGGWSPSSIASQLLSVYFLLLQGRKRGPWTISSARLGSA